MIKLLNIEFKKIKSYKIFWVCIVLYTTLFPLLFTSVRSMNITSNLKETAFSMMYSFPDLWHNITYFAGWFNILLYLIMILLVTNEYIFKTLRQNIIDGLSKAEIVLGKLLLGAALSLYSTILVIIVGLISGYSFAGDTFNSELIFSKFSFVGAYFLQTLGYMSFAILLSIIFKRQGFTIIFFIIYTTMIENIISLKVPENIGKFFPLETFSNLIKNPFSRLINGSVQQAPENVYIIASLIYLVVFSFSSYFILKKTDN